jgi:DNA-directed RNA polymerase specialized sigma24 family protein
VAVGIELDDATPAGESAKVLLTTDTELVQRAANGERQAFALVYAESFGCVWAFAIRRHRRRAQVEQLTSRILARAFAELESYDGQVPFAAWLLGVAKRVARQAAPRSATAAGAPAPAASPRPR